MAERDFCIVCRIRFGLVERMERFSFICVECEQRLPPIFSFCRTCRQPLCLGDHFYSDYLGGSSLCGECFGRRTRDCGGCGEDITGHLQCDCGFKNGWTCSKVTRSHVVASAR